MARGKRAGQPRTPSPEQGVAGAAQPPVVANEQGYGVRKETEALASAAPMSEGGGAPVSPTAHASPPPPGALPDMFGPSKYPDTMSAGGLPMEAPPAKEVLRSIYRAYPSPWIASLLGDDY